jgi:hypothetical protein
VSDGIWYQQEYLGSVHYFVFRDGQLPGRPDEVFVRFTNLNSLERLLQLPQDSILRVGEEEMNVKNFKKEVLGKSPYLGLENLHPLALEPRRRQ